ncbi:GAF domain-containing protein [Bacteroidota bacterium]
MNEDLKVDKNLPDEEIYKLLIPQIESLITADDTILSNLCNITAALKDSFEKISWVGFYILKEKKLHLGPFQGKIACTQINLGSGVCGTSASKRETIIVENVHEFPGHIACDSGSNSEIVLPIIYKQNLFGVLDLDSYRYSAFDTTDKNYLEQILKIVTSKLDLQNSLF